jgi:5-methylcytosine-specific restriction endonuclease McrA
MRDRARKRMADAREKLGGRCAQCGSTDELQIDHIAPGTKSFVLSKGASVSAKRWEEELAKCQLLCSKCHETKTNKDLKRQSGKDKHGTVSSRRYCACELCRKAHADYCREWRKRGPVV